MQGLLGDRGEKGNIKRERERQREIRKWRERIKLLKQRDWRLLERK